jgi:menaquinone-dependent protoporphyrinogen oxidase
MSALIVYSTRHGTTARCAKLIAERIPGGAELADLSLGTPLLEPHEVVIVGGAIYAGRIRPAITRFCESHRDALLARKVGLFICCLYTGDRARAQLSDAFPPWLSAHAFAARPIGGAVVQARLGMFERLLFRKVTGMRGDIDRVDEEALDGLVAAAGTAQR